MQALNFNGLFKAAGVAILLGFLAAPEAGHAQAFTAIRAVRIEQIRTMLQPGSTPEFRQELGIYRTILKYEVSEMAFKEALREELRILTEVFRDSVISGLEVANRVHGTAAGQLLRAVYDAGLVHDRRPEPGEVANGYQDPLPILEHYIYFDKMLELLFQDLVNKAPQSVTLEAITEKLRRHNWSFRLLPHADAYIEMASAVRSAHAQEPNDAIKAKRAFLKSPFAKSHDGYKALALLEPHLTKFRATRESMIQEFIGVIETSYGAPLRAGGISAIGTSVLRTQHVSVLFRQGLPKFDAIPNELKDLVLLSIDRLYGNLLKFLDRNRIIMAYQKGRADADIAWCADHLKSGS